ncbi:MAG TPA: hypothetical protein VGO98_02255 [Candidatus Saccharimonadales bacterium]|jgi:hypothetical protein|nr:hypothetical protein [Candidatus Saccharimonadales bacterium]
MNPKLIVEQKITPFVNKYAVYMTTPSGDKDQLVAFAQQKRLAFKEKVIFYSDKQKTQPAFTFRAEKVFDVHGKYIVEDLQGNRIGSFRKEFKASLLKSTWHILDTHDQPQFTIAENSLTLALFRRFVGFLPVIGDFAEIIVLFFRYHFALTNTAGQAIGKYEKITLFRDHYKLSITDDAFSQQDWRVFAAMAVALDALQSR